MPTFIVASELIQGEGITLAAEDARHLVRVLRAGVGESVRVTTNAGTVAVAKIMSVEPLKLVIQEIAPARPPDPIRVALPLIQTERLEWAVQKLAELNVATVDLITTQRGQIKDLTPSRLKRLERVAREAQKQCGRDLPLTITPPRSLVEAIPLAPPPPSVAPTVIAPPAPLTLVAASDGEPFMRIRTVLANHPPTAIICVIGPEGGLAPDETTLLREKNFTFVNLGETILRSETAAIVMATLARILVNG